MSATAMASTETKDIETVYVDETAGSDESGDGTRAQPYKSAAHAIFAQGPSPPLAIMIRKSDTEEYAPIGVSPLKKARKGAEGLEKQRKKALETEAKAKEQAELLEKSKAITLTENPGLPKAVKVRDILLWYAVELDLLAVKDQGLKGITWTKSSSVRVGP
jgi:asparaginyl-tRNA synthetase